MEELLERRHIEDLVRGGLRGVDDKLSVCEWGNSHTGLKKEGRGPLWGISYLVRHLGLASFSGGTSSGRDFLQDTLSLLS